MSSLKGKQTVLTVEELKSLTGKKTKRKTKNEESKLQKACIKWFDSQYPRHVLFAIPNGGGRTPIQGAILKAEGVRAGVPDLFLAFAKEDTGGLFIEMKTEEGKLNENQKVMIPKLRKAGYQVEVVRSFDEFKSLVDKYLCR